MNICSSQSHESSNKIRFVGNEALARKPHLIMYKPIERGCIYNMDSMESIWSHAFYNEMQADSAGTTRNKNIIEI